jgi:hypothetical protein
MLVFVPGNPFKPSLMFVGKAEAYQVLHSRVGSWPHPETLYKAEKVCQGQTLWLITKIHKLYSTGPRAERITRFCSDKEAK